MRTYVAMGALALILFTAPGEAFHGYASAMNAQLDSFRYDDAIARKFLIATFVWGLVGMTVGLVVALQLALFAWSIVLLM